MLSVIGVFDLMYATTTVAGVYYRQMEVYCVALVVYLILTLVASRLLEPLAKSSAPRLRSRCPAPTRLKTRRIIMQIPLPPALWPPHKLKSRSSASRACARASARSRYSRVSTCPSILARSSPLSALRVRVNRPFCAASICSRPPDAGHIWFHGQDLTAERCNINKLREDIGMVFQGFNLFNNMDVLDNCTLAPSRSKKMGKVEAEKNWRYGI